MLKRIPRAQITGPEERMNNFDTVPITLAQAPASLKGDSLRPSLYIAKGMVFLKVNQFSIVKASGDERGPGKNRESEQTGGNAAFSGTFPVAVTGNGVAGGARAAIAVTGGKANLLIFLPPRIRNARVLDNAIMLDLDPISSGSYQVQSTPVLNPPQWVNVGSPILPSNSTTPVCIPIGNTRLQYFRASFTP